MKAENRRERLIAQLKNYGLNNIERLSDEQLEAEFRKAIIEWSENFVRYNLGTKEAKTPLEWVDSAILEKIKMADDFYEIFNGLLIKYPHTVIYEALLSTLNAQKTQKALLILEIKYRQYQESLIEQIAQKITFMPEEERASFMLFIEKNRDEVELLKDILSQLKDDKISREIGQISNIKKYILSEFMAEDLEKNYKQFFNNSQDKQDLIARLRKISNAYSKQQLDDMTKEDLMDILTSIRQKELQDKKDREDFAKYVEAFKSALYEDNASNFDALVIQVLEDVSKDCLANLRAKLRAEDALFESKFAMAQKEWNRIKAHG